MKTAALLRFDVVAELIPHLQLTTSNRPSEKAYHAAESKQQCVDPFVAIDHVQLAMPRGREDDARAFYVQVLGMTELAKPEELAKRGGCWFASGDVQLHVGVEDDFRPAKKAHPGLRCTDYHSLLRTLRDAGIDVTEESAGGMPRAFIHDPFGNRIELVRH